MKLILSLSHLRHNSGEAKPFSGGAKCPLCPLLEKSLGVMYVNVHVSRHLKEELAWAIHKQLWVISNKLSVIPLRN